MQTFLIAIKQNFAYIYKNTRKGTMALRKIEVLSVPVTDQDKAIEFYRDILGFELLVDQQFEENMRWVQLAVNRENVTTISLVTWFEDMKPGTLRGQVITSNDIVKDRDEIIKKGVEVSEVENTPWGKFAYLADPDGNVWAIHES